MRILITGGAGYIGTELCLRLMSNPQITSIRIYDNLSRGNFNFFLGPDKLDPKVSFIEADLLDTYSLRKEIAKADCVIHLAAKVTTPFADQNPHLFDQVNNWGTAELCYALEAGSCPKIIYLSSVSVYGAAAQAADLHTVPNPKTFYGISKRKGEKHVERLQTKKSIAIVRCANVYGYSKSMRFDAVINRFVLRAKNHNRITINGSGEQSRAFVHIHRVVSFLEKLLFAEAWQTHYNLVDRNLTVNDIAYTLKEILPDMEMLYVDQQLSLREIQLAPDAHVQALVGNNEREFQEELREFLGRMG